VPHPRDEVRGFQCALADLGRGPGFTDFCWPIFRLAGWGISLGFHTWDTFGNKPFSREQIEPDAARLRTLK
jgi:2TM domain-containing protein